MKQNLLHIIIILLLGFTSCIKPYEPDFKSEAIQKYVVEGMVSSEEGWQTVTVSISSTANSPMFIPLANCYVEIIDELGQKFELNYVENGQYRVWMSSEYLVPGRAYQTRVITSEGDILQSSFDRMPQGPEIDEVFFEIETLPTNDPETWTSGIQFYTNLLTDPLDSKYYRWKVIETWEYHSRFPIEFYYDGQVQQVVPPDSSEMYCWANQTVDEVITLSTVNLINNSYPRFPLHYVENTSSRLAILYSFMLQQMAISEDAYRYWDQLRINSSAQGGLYASQPLAIKGNIVNISNPDIDVLGFFQVSSVASKRVFVEPLEELPLSFSDKCSPAALEHGFIEIRPRNYPAYLMSVDGDWTMTLLNDECVLCTLRGGTTERPVFWPSNNKKNKTYY